MEGGTWPWCCGMGITGKEYATGEERGGFVVVLLVEGKDMKGTMSVCVFEG